MQVVVIRFVAIAVAAWILLGRKRGLSTRLLPSPTRSRVNFRMSNGTVIVAGLLIGAAWAWMKKR